MSTTNTLPAPLPSPVELAAEYIRIVRSNGPREIEKVAMCYDITKRGVHYTLHVRYEVGELLPDQAWTDALSADDGSYRELGDRCRTAAELAIETFYGEVAQCYGEVAQ